jgi:hypothetical protein
VENNCREKAFSNSTTTWYRSTPAAGPVTVKPPGSLETDPDSAVDDSTTAETRQPRLVEPPTRRRWTVSRIAAGMLAVLIAGLWWVARPTIDSRFVGTWIRA